MPECHTCPHYLDPRLQSVPWEKTPCSRCTLSSEPRHSGRIHVSRDSSSAVEAEEAFRLHGEACARSTAESFTRAELEDGLRRLLQLLDDSPATARIVLFRLCHPTSPLKEIAATLGITTQAVHARLKRIRDRWPELKLIIPMREKG